MKSFISMLKGQVARARRRERERRLFAQVGNERSRRGRHEGKVHIIRKARMHAMGEGRGRQTTLWNLPLCLWSWVRLGLKLAIMLRIT